MKLIATSLTDRMLSTHNPLRGLTMARVVAELENGQRGDYSHLQWLYHFIEKRDATLRGAKRRILSSLLKLDWDIKIRDGLSKGEQATAKKQAEHLKEAYGRIKGFRATLKHLALAEFRGFAHVEKHVAAGGEIIALQPVPQWHWCRDGIYGDWKFQENALRGGTTGTDIAYANFLIREVEDPIDEIAVIAFVRKGLSSKDFDSFIARYGIPFVFWILSEPMAAALATDPTKLSEWMAIMRGIGADGEGILPGGDLKTLDSSAGGKDQNPFLQHLGYQDEQIVMAATSGKLTMLNEATGLGSGNSEAHQDTFDDIAMALAMEISEVMHEQFDTPELARVYPGQEVLCYFELAAKDAEDVGELVSNVQKLDDAGWEIDGAELSEKTGYTLTRKAASTDGAQQATPNITEEAGGTPPAEKEQQAAAGADPAAADAEQPEPTGLVVTKNRAAGKPLSLLTDLEGVVAESNDRSKLLLAAMRADLRPLGEALERAMAAGDQPAMTAALRKISAEMPDFLASSELEEALGREFIQALTEDEP
jgi:phage gp29-like protein